MWIYTNRFEHRVLFAYRNLPTGIIQVKNKNRIITHVTIDKITLRDDSVRAFIDKLTAIVVVTLKSKSVSCRAIDGELIFSSVHPFRKTL